jgi:hypothetical protein
MNSRDETEGSERDRARARRNASYAAARQMARAVADREQGRRRLNATTVGVSFASVVAAGIVVAVLPGSTHASVTGNPAGKSTSSSSGTAKTGSSSSNSTPSSSSSDSGSSNSSNPSNSSNSSSSGNSGTLQQPASAPQYVGGGGGVTSGGT